MSAQVADLKPAEWVCMRCGHDYREDFDPAAPLIERQCPECRSNSVRRLPQKKPAKVN